MPSHSVKEIVAEQSLTTLETNELAPEQECLVAPTPIRQPILENSATEEFAASESSSLNEVPVETSIDQPQAKEDQT
jgi:hypothetical protein